MSEQGTPNEDTRKAIEEVRLQQAPSGMSRYRAKIIVTIETEVEDDGRWIAELMHLGLLAYGSTEPEAIHNVLALIVGDANVWGTEYV